MIDGMRRVVAMARIVNGNTPDIRITAALRNYDKCKIITVSGTGSR